MVRLSGASRETTHGSNNAEQARRRQNPRYAQTHPVLIRTLELELWELGPGLILLLLRLST